MTNLKSNVSSALAGFAHRARWTLLPRRARVILKLSVFDWGICALAGKDSDISRILRRQIVQEQGRGEATLIGSGAKYPARGVALANGATSHAFDFDDTHFLHIGHPSVAILPACLAMAERQRCTGLAFLESAMIGFETSIRLGGWLGRRHYQAGFHQTATAGAFGAALASGRLLGLDAPHLEQALNIVSTRASGLKSQFGSMGKPLNAGIAAANGVEAALLAAGGFLSSTGALEGGQGFGATHHGENNTAALDGLGNDFVLENINYKFHACCHGTHAMIEALKTALQSGTAPTSILVTVHPRWLDVCNITAPQSGLEMKFSFKAVAATVMCGRDTGSIKSFSDAAVLRPDLVKAAAIVSVESETSIKETAARVEVHFAGGRVATADHDLATPLDTPDLRTKLLAKGRALVGSSKTNDLFEAVQALETTADVNGFSLLLR